MALITPIHFRNGYAPAYGFTLTLPNATTLVRIDDPAYGAAARAPYDNTKAIVLYNIDTTNNIYGFFGRTGLSINDVSVDNAFIIPASGSLSLEVDQMGVREGIGLANTEDYVTVLGGYPVVNLYFLAAAGTDVQINITYLQARGFNPTN